MRIRTQALIAVAIAIGGVVLSATLLAHISAGAQRTLQAQQDSRVVARDVTSLLVLTQQYNLNFDAQPAAQWHQVHASLLRTIGSAVAAQTPAEPELLALRDDAACCSSGSPPSLRSWPNCATRGPPGSGSSKRSSNKRSVPSCWADRSCCCWCAARWPG